MRVAEEVVQVAEGFLVGADQECGQVVLVAFLEIMHFQRALDLALADEAVDLAVGVAGDVGQHGACASGTPFSRWIGMIGNSWSMAQLSGSDWNTDMLQNTMSDKHRLQAVEFLRDILPACGTTSRIRAQVTQYRRSVRPRCSSDSRPSLNICSAFSRAVCASW